MIFDEFVQLNRTFQSLVSNEGTDDEAGLRRLHGRNNALSWPDLLEEPRVILLSEAGSGKTAEIRNAARTLRAEGKPAFFLRIEHMADVFGTCFEEGSVEEFDFWVGSGQPGWLLLDSVDEARLRDPKDFERAIKQLGLRIKSNVQNAHILITSRTTAWRPKTDLLLCQNAFPHTKPDIITAAADDDTAAYKSEGAEPSKDRTAKKPGAFIIVTLNDLYGEQVDRFAAAQNVIEIHAFRKALDRAEAWAFTTRPLDLAETAQFWNKYHRIGSRLELILSSIDKRLDERDQDRSDARPITVERTRFGARLVAAAATLTQGSAIRVPDGSENAKGFPIKNVLSDWDDRNCAILLSRPIFDEGIYGTVRFHHRSVREYLTAEWLHSLLVDEVSRSRVESLLFRTQYGIAVVVPVMRPILPWLAILDERILSRVIRVAPEVLFEGGDPSQLPLETRCKVLKQTCEKLAQPAHGRSVTDYAAVQRFASADLASEISGLLNQYKDDDDILWFLLRMTWHGGIKELLAEVRSIATSSRAKYTRLAAFTALGVIGGPADLEAVRLAFIEEDRPLRRDWLAELVLSLPPSNASNAWLVTAVERADLKPQFEADSLADAIKGYGSNVPIDMLLDFLTSLHGLIIRSPFVHRHYCGMSAQFAWLAKAAAEAIVRLLQNRHRSALELQVLSILRMLPIAEQFGSGSLGDLNEALTRQVRAWQELNHALFWTSVTEARAEQNPTNRLTAYWQVGIAGVYWVFNADDFPVICDDIKNRILLDDRHVALSMAFKLSREAGSPREWNMCLKRLVAGEQELSDALAGMLHPPAADLERWRRREARWARRRGKVNASRAREEDSNREFLAERLDIIRGQETPGIINKEQVLLYQELRKSPKSNDKWGDSDWKALIPKFGNPVAEAFRDGAVGYWRKHQALLRAEGAVTHATRTATIFGLTGLAIEASESAGWLEGVTASDAERAARYAVHELNGFPIWLAQVYRAFPAEVVGVIMGEIDYERGAGTIDVLSDVSSHGQWMWDGIAPALTTILSNDDVSVRDLSYLLTIVQGSSLRDEQLCDLAAGKARTSHDTAIASMWFAVWAGLDPTAAIPSLAARLAETKIPADQTELAVRFITHLVGDGRTKSTSRQAYRTVEHMKALYLLMHKYICQIDDIDRVGGGVYSPEPRDDAQDARNSLLSFIQETRGKEAYLALMDISRLHPEESGRPWAAFHAKAKAALDADLSPWTPKQVREFNDDLVRTPTNHRDLWYLAVDRLLDLRADLEDGDASIASLLQSANQETEVRKFIGGWCRERSAGRYNVPQEEELADKKRPDLRFFGVGFDGPVPVELKLADNWTGPHLFERLENQLCGDYLRDRRSSRGVFLLVYNGVKPSWELPNASRARSFSGLIEALQAHWLQISTQFPGVEDIAVVGIDLTRRGIDAKAAAGSPENRPLS